MVAGNWYNQDGLYLQYGTQKAVQEVGGDYLVYGDTREIEQYLNMVPMQFSSAFPQIPAVAGTFSGTGTAAAAGIQSLTTFFPLAQSAPVTAASSSVYSITVPQIFIEQVEVVCLSPVTTSGSPTAATVSLGLVCTSPQTNANAQFAQITSSSLSSTGTQLLNAFPVWGSSAVTLQATQGSKTLYTAPTEGFTFNTTSGGVAVSTGGGGWVGNFSPLPTNSITPLPQSAWLSATSAFTSGTNPAFTSGLFKVRIKYVMLGNINY